MTRRCLEWVTTEINRVVPGGTTVSNTCEMNSWTKSTDPHITGVRSKKT